MRRFAQTIIATTVLLAVVVFPALAQGAAGDLYVTSNDATATTSTILKFNPSTPGFTTFATTDEGVSFLNFGPSGDLFATNEDTGAILKVDRNGAASPITNIPNAYGIAREPGGTLVVADYTGSSTSGITRVDPATGGKQPLTAEQPLGASFYGVAAAPDGTIFAAQNSAGNLLRITPSGTVTTFADQLVNPVDIDVDIDGSLLVTDENAGPGGTLVRVDPSTGASTPVAALAAPRSIYGLTRGADGFIYAADLGQDAVMRIDPKTGAADQVFADPALRTAVDVEAEPPDCHGQLATIYGTPGNDTISGGPFADVIAGLGGKDKISGLAGKDVLCGGPGKDTLKGGKGKDRLFGDAGKDSLDGGKGKDKLVGGKGKDRCLGKGDSRKSC